MKDNLFSNTASTHSGQSAGYGDRKLAKDSLLKLDARFSRAVNIYNKNILSEDSFSYWKGDFNQNRATAIESNLLPYSQDQSSVLSASHLNSQAIECKNPSGLTVDVHQTECNDELPNAKKVVYCERIPSTTSHLGNQSALTSRQSHSAYSVGPYIPKQVASTTPIRTPVEHPAGFQDLQPIHLEANTPFMDESSRSKIRDFNQPGAKNVHKANSGVTGRSFNYPACPTGKLTDKIRNVNAQYKEETIVDITQTKYNNTSPHNIDPIVTTNAGGSVIKGYRKVSPEEARVSSNHLPRKVILETLSEGRTQSPKDQAKQSKPDRGISSPGYTTNAHASRGFAKTANENPYASIQNRTKTASQSREGHQIDSPGPSSFGPGSQTDRMTTDDNYDNSTYIRAGRTSFIVPDPSAARDLDNASPETLELCNRHPVHYSLFVYFSSSTVDEDLMPFRRKSFMEKLVGMDNIEDIQYMLSTKCGRDAYSDRRVIAIERQSGTEIHLSDLAPETAFVKGLPRRRLTIAGPSFAHICCAIALFEVLLPSVIRSAIFPYRLPQGSSTRYSAGERISSMHNWESGRSDGTVYLRKQFDDKGGWKSFIPH